MGGLEAGACSQAGYTVPKGQFEQKAGPCGTLKFKSYGSAAALAATSCDTYRRIDNGACADSCVPGSLGVCPRSIIISMGGLEAGTCSQAGYTVPTGEFEQKAGPCGTLKFKAYGPAASLLGQGTGSVKKSFDNQEYMVYWPEEEQESCDAILFAVGTTISVE